MTRLKLVKKRKKNARLAFTWRFMQRYVVENRNLCEKKVVTDLKIMYCHGCQTRARAE